MIWKTPDAEKIIAYCARVSNPKNQENPEIAKLLRYCIKNGHWSIYEQASMCMEVETSRAIAAQILRHRSFSFQEFSLRYSQATEWEPIELRKQAGSNRQSSTEPFNPIVYQSEEVVDVDSRSIDFYPDVSASESIEQLMSSCFDLYDRLIKLGVAKESARFILPLATKTKLYMTGNIRSWIHYIALRADEHTQKEHQDIALAIQDIFIKEFPTVSEALGWS